MWKMPNWTNLFSGERVGGVSVRLPAWARLMMRSRNQVPIVIVDATPAYKFFLAEYKIEIKDQYWLEVCYQSIKLELQLAMGTFGFEIKIRDPEKRWAQSKYPVGKGSLAATQGREARKHYKNLRGTLP